MQMQGSGSHVELARLLTWVVMSARRSLQGDPYAAVFHKRIKMSSGGHRIKVEQKFQLLAPGVLPVKYHSIWHRIEDENSASSANAATQQETVL